MSNLKLNYKSTFGEPISIRELTAKSNDYYEFPDIKVESKIQQKEFQRPPFILFPHKLEAPISTHEHELELFPRPGLFSDTKRKLNIFIAEIEEQMEMAIRHSDDNNELDYESVLAHLSLDIKNLLYFCQGLPEISEETSIAISMNVEFFVSAYNDNITREILWTFINNFKIIRGKADLDDDDIYEMEEKLEKDGIKSIFSRSDVL